MRNKIKKALLLIMALFLFVSLSACKKEKNDVQKTNETPSVVSEEKTSETSEKAEQIEETKEDEKSQAEEKAEESSVKTSEEEPKTEDKNTEPTPAEQAPVENQSPKAETPVETPAQSSDSEKVQETSSEPTPPADLKSVAMSYKGKSASSLAAAIGQPGSKSYASSCIGDGEDGEWYYNGFTVYTYRDTDGSERVEDVF